MCLCCRGLSVSFQSLKRWNDKASFSALFNRQIMWREVCVLLSIYIQRSIFTFVLTKQRKYFKFKNKLMFLRRLFRWGYSCMSRVCSVNMRTRLSSPEPTLMKQLGPLAHPCPLVTLDNLVNSGHVIRRTVDGIWGRRSHAPASMPTLTHRDIRGCYWEPSQAEN